MRCTVFALDAKQLCKRVSERHKIIELRLDGLRTREDGLQLVCELSVFLLRAFAAQLECNTSALAMVLVQVRCNQT
jgi:hypothetical protein